MKLSINHTNNETKNVQNAQVTNTAIALQGSEYTVKDPKTGKGVTFESVIPAAIVAASKTPAEPVREAEEITADAEVKSERVKSEKSAAPKRVTLKRKVTLKKKQPISKAPQAQPVSKAKPSPSTGERGEGLFSIVPYTNKQGETGYFLFGFASQEEAKGLADRMAKSVREGFRYENHVRYDVVGFPPRYAQMAQQMCEALNAGDAAAVAKIAASTFDVYAAAVADGKAESDRKRAERKEAEAKAKAKEVAKVKKSAGLYSKEDVAAMLNDVLAGKDVPEEIKKLLVA